MARRPTDRQFKLVEGKHFQWCVVCGNYGNMIISTAHSNREEAEARLQVWMQHFPENRLEYRVVKLRFDVATAEESAADDALEAWSEVP